MPNSRAATSCRRRISTTQAGVAAAAGSVPRDADRRDACRTQRPSLCRRHDRRAAGRTRGVPRARIADIYHRAGDNVRVTIRNGQIALGLARYAGARRGRAAGLRRDERKPPPQSSPAGSQKRTTARRMKTDGLSINLATVRKQFGLKDGVEACLKHGITAIAPWRDHIEAVGLAEAARIIKSNGMKVTGYCRGGLFPAADAAGRQAAIDMNKQMIDEAAAIGADCIVMIGGGLPPGSRDLPAAREMFADGMAAVLPHARAAEGAARDRAAAPDGRRRPRLHLDARAGARHLRRARQGRRRRGRRLSRVVGPRPRAGRSSVRDRASSRTISATGWCRRRICCSTAA